MDDTLDLIINLTKFTKYQGNSRGVKNEIYAISLNIKSHFLNVLLILLKSDV